MAWRVPASFSLLLWAIIWETGARAAGTDLFPPLSAILVTGVELLRMVSFQEALMETAYAFAVGMALSIVAGITLGVAMGRFDPVDKIFNIWVNIFISAPLTAVVPALLPLLGIGQASVIATVFLFAVWVIVVDTREGIRNVNPSLIEMAKVNGASPWKMFSRVLIPAALPEVLTGLRLSVVRGVKGVIIGQLVIAFVGFGELFETYLQTFAMERFWALVMIVFLIGFALVELVGQIERRLTFYAKSR